ncbi:helix-turn-helix domain-containing protein [Tenacibaculum amylolyticum]|uniref:helix-turn-helix domain-containing protein n=1 Tax=Tenacibaculum amylolyticum TaxID=104269 RepID=UPI0038953B3C
MNDLITFLIYSGVTLTVLLILLLFNNRKQFSITVLIGILLSLLLLFLTYGASYLENTIVSFLIVPLGSVAPYALGPLLFNYVKSVYNQKVTLKELVQNLVPFFISLLLFSIPQYFTQAFSNNTLHNNLHLVSFIIPFIGFGYFIYYVIRSTKLLKRYRISLKEQYSYLKNIDLKWFSIWVYGCVTFVIIDVISGGILFIFPSLKFVLALNLIYLTALIWYMGYYGLQQTPIFLFQENIAVEATTSEKTIQEKVTPKIEDTSDLKDKLEALFQTSQLYQQQNLSLREVAELLNITDKKLSTYINTHLNLSFYEYVNSYRIKHFKKSIRNGAAKELTLLALAFDAGFNSKATFNRVFKKQEGSTPLQFKKEVEKGLMSSNESI